MRLRKPCHECGSTRFGSYKASPTDMHRICYGYVEGVPCAVQWHERDDDKHFYADLDGSDQEEGRGGQEQERKD